MEWFPLASPFESFVKKHDYLVCIDSDGCAMDTMDIKHIRCFGPRMVDEWQLDAWRQPILDRWNVINLYSMTRGINRFKALAIALEEVNEQYTPIEGVAELKDWAENAKELSNGAIEMLLKEKDCPVLAKALAWSKAVNASINQLPEEEKLPFPGVREGIAAAHAVCDVAIVSSANLDAVLEEWEKHKLLEHTDIVCSQNAGSKAFCIAELLKKGYAQDHVLMLGDAPGDRDAAKKNGVLYFPILVRHEYDSWIQFKDEALAKFLDGSFAGEYQEKLLDAFVKNLS